MTRQEAGILGYQKSKDKHLKRYVKFKMDYEKDPKICILCRQIIPLPIKVKIEEMVELYAN